VDTRLLSSNLAAKSNDDRRIERMAGFSSTIAPSILNLLSALYKLRASFRSFLGHTRFQFARGGTRIDLGASCQFQDGCWQANKRTLARAEGIEKLKATHPWVDTPDLRIFLMGFDAGEEYSSSVPRQGWNSQESPSVHEKTCPAVHS
jgi:hypothetical protein